MRKRIGSILGLLLCAAMAFGQGQAIERDSQTLTNTSPQPAGTKPFVQIDNRLGTGIVSIAYNFGGTIGTSSIVLKGCMRPGTAGLCDTLETNTATTDSKRTVTGLYDWYTVTPTFTGGTNPVVNVNWTMIPGGVAAGNALYTGFSSGSTTQISAFNGSQTNPFICAGSAAQCGMFQIITAADGTALASAGAPYNPGNGTALTSGMVVLNKADNGTTADLLRTSTADAGVKVGQLEVAQVATPCYITTATTTVCKATAGILHRIVVNTAVASATIKIFNVASGSCVGTPGSGGAGVITLPSTVGNPFFVDYNMTMNAGVCIVTSGATDIQAIFQ
jgi:hypothetical protein